MFNRKVNREFHDVWDGMLKLADADIKVLQLLSKRIDRLESKLKQTTVEVADIYEAIYELNEAVFEDDDQACDC